MAKFFTSLNEENRNFIEQQRIFFVATSPNEGRINLSPKGMDTLRVLNSNQVAYLDLTGSGNETAAHILANNRMTMMFCSFEQQPLILRLYGQGSSVKPRDSNWSELLENFDSSLGQRQIIILDIESVQTSCGYSIPLFESFKERKTLHKWAEKKGEEGIKDYWQEKNQTSIDGLPTDLLKK